MKKRVCILLAASLCVIMFLLIYDAAQRKIADTPAFSYDRRLLGAFVVEDDFCIQGKARRKVNGNEDVFMQGVRLPADEDGKLYLPQTMDGKWIGEILPGSSHSYICILNDALLEDKVSAIRSGKEFKLWVVGDDDYAEYGLIITGLPVTELREEFSEMPEEVDFEEDPDAYTFEFVGVSYGQIKILDPCVNSSKYEIFESNVKYHVKGGVTRTLPKKSYALSLLDHQGENLDVPLLGMRSDHSWKLNALVTDQTRIREKTAMDLWGLFAEKENDFNESGAKAEYTELIVNGRYMGIYTLVEPIDEKKLSLDSNDILYKSTGEVVPSEEEFQQAVDEEWKFIVSFRIRYPKEPADYGQVWFPVRDYMDRFFRDDPVDAEDVKYIDPDNLMDNYMFLMAISANDNSLKNTYYAARRGGADDYVMYRIPWDLDYTFGNCFLYERKNHTDFNPDYTVSGRVEYTPTDILDYGIQELPKLLEADIQGLDREFMDKWQTYRNDFMSDESVEQLLLENRDRLADSGAYVRECARWPEEEVSGDIGELLEYEKKRLNWLDEYFKNLVLTK